MHHRINRNHRNKHPVKQRRGRGLQAADGVGHRDLVRQSKKWLLFSNVNFSNVTGGFAYGYRNVNISTGNSGIANNVFSQLMTTAALTYEEYRIRRVTVFAQPGQGYTNDNRIKSSIFARVDVNNQNTAVTTESLNQLICSESSVNRTFTERSNIKLVDFKPICYTADSPARPILNSALQWYDLSERDSHLWRGATVGPVIPEPNLTPNSLAVTLWVDVEIEFRTRSPDFANFSAFNLASIQPRNARQIDGPVEDNVESPDEEISKSEDVLKS